MSSSNNNSQIVAKKFSPMAIVKSTVAKTTSTSVKHKLGGGVAAKKENGKTRSSLSADSKILNAAAAMKVKHGKDQLPKDQIASITGIAGASTIRKAIAKLTKAGLVVQTKEAIIITDKGEDVADPDATDAIPMTNSDHHKKIKEGLQGKELAVFERIADGCVHSKKNVAKDIGMETNSTFRKLLAAMSKKQILEHGGDSMQLAKTMFPFAPRPE